MNLLRTLLTISGMTMLSRITGLLRELLIARAFGASGFTDAFFVAFRIPNLLRRLFAEGAFSQAFVPILAEYANKKGADPAKELIDKVATALMWTLLLITVVGIVAAPGVVYLVATGLDGNSEIFGLSVLMTRIMFPYILFMSMVALAGGILNTWREFRIPAITPVLLNVSFIIASLFVAPYLSQPVLALAGAVFVGGLLQLANMLRAQAARSGCYQSPQPFHPHITLLRDAGHAVPIPPPGFGWSFPVTEFALYSSSFARGRTRYTQLQRWTLTE